MLKWKPLRTAKRLRFLVMNSACKFFDEIISVTLVVLSVGRRLLTVLAARRCMDSSSSPWVLVIWSHEVTAYYIIRRTSCLSTLLLTAADSVRILPLMKPRFVFDFPTIMVCCGSRSWGCPLVSLQGILLPWLLVWACYRGRGCSQMNAFSGSVICSYLGKLNSRSLSLMRLAFGGLSVLSVCSRLCCIL